jgi:hypothetical protein
VPAEPFASRARGEALSATHVGAVVRRNVSVVLSAVGVFGYLTRVGIVPVANATDATEPLPSTRRCFFLHDVRSVAPHYDIFDVLRVAFGHFDNVTPDCDDLTAPLLPCVSTAFAHGERHLIARAPSFSRVREHSPAKLQDSRIIVERFARVAPDLRHRLTKGGERFPPPLEPEHVSLHTGIRNIVRSICGTMTGYPTSRLP